MELSRHDIVIVGGGPTGVEVAGALAEMKKNVLPHEYQELDCGEIDIYLVQSGPMLLKGMSGQASNKALAYLTDLGVKVILNDRVTDFDGDDDNPSWIDGHTVVFLSSRAGRKNIFSLDLITGAATPLTDHDGSAVRFPRASADGSIMMVVATDAREAARLLGWGTLPETRGTTCFYFAADRAPIPGADLVLNGEERGPINSLLENVVDFLPNLLWAGLIFFIGMMVARIVARCGCCFWMRMGP